MYFHSHKSADLQAILHGCLSVCLLSLSQAAPGLHHLHVDMNSCDYTHPSRGAEGLERWVLAFAVFYLEVSYFTSAPFYWLNTHAAAQLQGEG